jgi:hypothetical protein
VTEWPEPDANDYLSVMVSAWIMAMEPHIASLLLLPGPRRQPSPPENANGATVSILCALAIESYASRLAIITDWQPKDRKRDDTLSFLTDGPPSFGRAPSDEVAEVFLLRNALAHNHIWSMREIGSTYSIVVQKRLRGRTDWLWREHARGSGFRTRRLQLNLVPDLVGYADARKVLGVTVRTLDALTPHDLANMTSPAKSTRIRVGNQILTLTDAAALFRV